MGEFFESNPADFINETSQNVLAHELFPNPIKTFRAHNTH